MRIKKIQLMDYKRFKNLTIDLGENPKRIVALVGPNGCGKSSVFDAILFTHTQYVGRIGEGGNATGKYHALQENGFVNRENVSITFVEGNYSAVIQGSEIVGNKNSIFSFRSAFRYNTSLDIKEIKAVPKIDENNYGANNASAMDAKMERNYRSLYAKYNKYLNDKDAKPSEAKAYIIGELNEAIKNCLNIEIESLGNIENSEGSIFFKKEDTERTFDFSLLSAGEKEVVDILLDLYLRRDYYTNTIYIIDEPELHLNTSIQRNLLIEVNKMIPENCQIWIATHSVGFLRAMQEELNDISDIIEFKHENQWAKETYILEPIQKNHYNWKRIFSTALDDLSELVSPKRIIYCEGRDQPRSDGTERGFDAQVYNSIFGEKHSDTLFISSGGNTELDQRSDIAIKILSKVFSDLEIWVLKDRDMASGKLVTEAERNNYLESNPINHRVLLRYELENYLFDKEIIQKYSSEKSLFFDESQYDGFVTDIINQNIKEETGRIKNITGLSVPVNADIFKISLSKFITPETQVYKELEDVIFERR